MKTFRKKYLFTFAFSVFYVALAFSFSFAENRIQIPLGSTNSLPQLFSSIVDTIIMLGTVVAALAIMYGGFLYVTASGDEEKLGKAKNSMTWALVGTAVLLGAKVIAKAIEETIRQIN